VNYTVQKIRAAATRLGTRGLLQAGDSLSQRVAGTGQIMLLTVEIDSAHTVVLAQLHEKSDGLTYSEAHSENPLRQHMTVYQNRKDVGAILLNRQPWAGTLRELGQGMPGIFDEQIRHLGTRVARLEHQIITPVNCTFLRNGENAFVLENQVLCLGMTLDRAIFNAELLEKCAKAFVLASSTGKPVGKIPWLVRWIANGRLMKDERYAAQQHALGQVPVFKSAY
jgi:ribulose-5-phosphate 4-epimerase/fuculose-1-phosphate aldolase